MLTSIIPVLILFKVKYITGQQFTWSFEKILRKVFQLKTDYCLIMQKCLILLMNNIKYLKNDI